VKITRFDPASDLIIVKARIWVAGGETRALLGVESARAFAPWGAW
jgi:hypothetical protein